MILTPDSEGTLLQLDIFTAANQVGDEGTALREASLGRKLGFNMFMCQNMSSVNGSFTTAAGAVNHVGGYAKGYDGSIVTDVFSGALAIGQFVTLNGFVYQVKAHTETLGATTAVTFTQPLAAAIADDDVITAQNSGYLVNLVGGYAAGWTKAIAVDVGSDVIQVGQVVSFSNTVGAPLYTIIGTDGSTSITLDRPLDVAIADDAPVYLGPTGNFNFAFHRNAIALVVRPLALPKAGTGALSSVVNYNDLSMRATITYDGNKQGHLVTLDMLFGIAVLDHLLGAVMLG